MKLASTKLLKIIGNQKKQNSNRSEGVWQRLGGRKPVLKKWQKEAMGNSQAKINRLEEELQELHEEWHQNENSEEIRRLIIEKRDELWQAYRVQEREWHRKSQVRWVVDGDRNTHYFYIVASPGRRGNFIRRIGVGSTIYEKPEEIKKGVADYFRGFYEQQGVMSLKDIRCDFKQLSEHSKQLLEKNFTEEEVWNTILQL